MNLSDEIKLGDSISASHPLPGHITDHMTLRDSISASPLVQVAGTAIYPTTGASQLAITPRQGSSVPDVDIRLTKNMWDMTTTGFGIAAGAAVAQRPGAVAGGLGMYALGYLRWRQVQRKREGS